MHQHLMMVHIGAPTSVFLYTYVCACVCAREKAIQDEPKMLSAGKAQLVLIPHNTVSITSSAIALKLLVAPLFPLLRAFTRLLTATITVMQRSRRTPDDYILLKGTVCHKVFKKNDTFGTVS